VLAAGAGVLLLVAHLTASTFLNRASDPVFAKLSALRQENAPRQAMAAPPAAPSRAVGFLAPEVAQGLVSVSETAGRTTITLRGEGMFDPGSAEVSSATTALLGRVGDALATLPGKIIVIGHTDNTRPGLSARFPSNYDLSKARARSVMDALVQRAGPASRYSVEARGDADPLAPNDSLAGRARNRRVDVVILAPAAAF
jgi:type VI secretion system protein ImpK